MGFRVILIENEVDIRVKLDNLVITKETKELWLPIDDISLLVVDNLKMTLTARMLCTLAIHNVGIVFCNQEHMPIGYYCSYDNHSRISKWLECQVRHTKDFYDVLWAKIIRRKISNQAKVLKKLNKADGVVADLYAFMETVKEGDVTNREAHAAKIYFNELMGTTFSRGNEDLLLNSGLDYGYAIFRSYLAKLCVGYGLNTQLGIHHHNEYNRFNLVDDLIEPFRPFVDYYTYFLLEGADFLTVEHRHRLVNLLNHKIIYKKKRMYLCNAMEEFVESIASYIGGKEIELEFPDIDGYLGEEDEV